MNHTVTVNIDNESKAPVKQQISTFLLTLSDNVSVISMNDHVVVGFKERLRNLLNNITEYITVRHGHQPDNSMIIDIESHTEIGTKQHRLHNHTFIQVQHNSNIQLNADKIRHDLDFKHVNIKYVKNSNMRLLDYIRKNLMPN